MRAIIQRVNFAKVYTNGVKIADIDKGVLILLGVGNDDSLDDARWLCDKISSLRIFPNDEGKLHYSIEDIGGEIALVSNFTLYADCKKGRRPSFTQAAPPKDAEKLYLETAQIFRDKGFKVKTGRFGASMNIDLQNDGPFTIFLDSAQRKEK